jgi:hypothetical protein
VVQRQRALFLVGQLAVVPGPDAVSVFLFSHSILHVVKLSGPLQRQRHRLDLGPEQFLV